MNITDVGHLTSDADTGEDKMEKGARRTGRAGVGDRRSSTPRRSSTTCARSNIELPDVLCRATDHIAEQIAFIADIERNGYTYRTSDGVYFDTSRQPDYGYLARLDKAGLEAGQARRRSARSGSATDFALWKFSPPGEQRQMEWDSPWGRGFPGWHIECSAMAQKYLGDYFDIHCGGEDHIPVHHTNEIAQTEARVGTRLANFWMHGYFLLPNDAKMAKSAGEFLRVQALVERGYDPLAYRYLCLTGALPQPAELHLGRAGRRGHRRSSACATASTRCRDAGASPMRRCSSASPPSSTTTSTCRARSRWRGKRCAATRPPAVQARDACGVRPRARPRARRAGSRPRTSCRRPSTRWPKRARGARKAKNWAEADRLRGELHDAGWEMEDQPGGYRLKPR